MVHQRPSTFGCRCVVVTWSSQTSVQQHLMILRVWCTICWMPSVTGRVIWPMSSLFPLHQQHRCLLLNLQIASQARQVLLLLLFFLNFMSFAYHLCKITSVSCCHTSAMYVCVCLSDRCRVCLSVCLSVTNWYCILTKKQMAIGHWLRRYLILYVTGTPLRGLRMRPW